MAKTIQNSKSSQKSLESLSGVVKKILRNLFTPAEEKPDIDMKDSQHHTTKDA